MHEVVTKIVRRNCGKISKWKFLDHFSLSFFNQKCKVLVAWCEIRYVFVMAFHTKVAVTIFFKLFIHFDLNILWSQLTAHTHINSLRSVRRCGNCQANSSEKLSNEWLASTVYIRKVSSLLFFTLIHYMPSWLTSVPKMHGI